MQSRLAIQGGIELQRQVEIGMLGDPHTLESLRRDSDNCDPVVGKRVPR